MVVQGDMMSVEKLVLSLFPGIDLFGRAFEERGYRVLRGPDILWGGKIEAFDPPAGIFEGVIGGSPCQDFSRARRSPPTGEGLRLIDEFLRCVMQAAPEWFMLENVPGVPSVNMIAYRMQRLNVRDTECGGRQRRLRTFQFGSRDGSKLLLRRADTTAGHAVACCMASEGEKSDRRDFADFCELQGLPRYFKLPGLSVKARYRAVGNGVSMFMGRVLAIAVEGRQVTHAESLCVCNCGRPVAGRSRHATAACRKRMERERRDRAAIRSDRAVTVTFPA